MPQDSFILVVSNLPKALKVWSCFKDYLRGSMSGQPGWTGTKDQYGLCHLRNWADTIECFNRLVASREFNRTLIVHVYSMPQEDLEVPKFSICNCTRSDEPKKAEFHHQLFAFVQCFTSAARAKSFSARFIDDKAFQDAFQFANQALFDRQWAGPGYSDSSNNGFPDYSQLAQYEPYQQYLPYGQYMPNPYNEVPDMGYAVQLYNGSYEPNADGIDVNISHGVSRGVRRAIHITGLPRDSDQAGLCDKLKKLRVKRFQIYHFRGYVHKGPLPMALVLMRNREEAKEAVSILDGYKWGGGRLSAKVAKDFFEDLPTVVNGST